LFPALLNITPFAQVSNLEQENRDLKEEHQTIKDDCGIYFELVNELEEELKELKEVSNRKTISLEQEVDAARQEAAAARQEAAAARQDAADATLRLQTAQETFKRELEAALQEAANATLRLQTAQETIQRLAAQISQISAAGEPIPTLMLEKGSLQSVNSLLSPGKHMVSARRQNARPASPPDKHMVPARRSSVSALSCLETPWNGVWAGIHRSPRPASPPDSAPSLRIQHSPATTSDDDKGGVLPLSRHEVRLLANTMTGFDMEVARLQATGATVCGNDETTSAQLAIQFIDRDLTQFRVKCPKISSPLSLLVLYNHNETQDISFKVLETQHLKTRLKQAEAWSLRDQVRVQKLQSSF
jgi:multidrug efflux pump subunit AcrA (membrane-fusion protein)